MGHRRARLTPFGRLFLVTRVLEEGWSVATTAESMGISRAMGHKWLHRFREEGLLGSRTGLSAPRGNYSYDPAGDRGRQTGPDGTVPGRTES